MVNEQQARLAVLSRSYAPQFSTLGAVSGRGTGTALAVVIGPDHQAVADEAKRIRSDALIFVQAERTVPVGRLAVTAPNVFGRLHVAPLMSAFLAKYPKGKRCCCPRRRRDSWSCIRERRRRRGRRWTTM